jgi:hypothetical protein
LRSRFDAVPVKNLTSQVTFCHAVKASVTPALPATLTQPTHVLAAGAAG